jgi:hypothetical protein
MKVGLAMCALAAAFALCSCTERDSSIKTSAPGAAAAESAGESKGLDPRSAFESSGLLGGMTALPESPIVLIAASGIPEAGVALSLGGALSTAAIARRQGRDHELVLASGARAPLPGPALAIAAPGERIAVACAESGASQGASLDCFKTEGEGERLAMAWKRYCPPIKRLLAVPGGRMAAADDAARLYIVDASTGAEIWGKVLQAPAADIAYAPGLVLAASRSSLLAFDESTGAPAWTASLTANAGTISAGNGTAFVLADSGSLSAFSLADGKGIGAATGPFDPALRPVADGTLAIVGLRGGGAAEIDVRSGQTQRAWSWEGGASFIAADRDSVFAGLYGRAGKGIFFASRAGEAGLSIAELDSPPFDSPLAVSGARGGLLVLLMDGSLDLLGRRREPVAAPSALDAAIAPPQDTASAIATALGRFKPGDGVEPGRYLRFDLFIQGMPVDVDIAFTAFRYEPPASARRGFAAEPASNGAIVAIYDEAGRELAASIDELGSTSRAAAYMEKGKTYWIVAGWTYQAVPGPIRLFLR